MNRMRYSLPLIVGGFVAFLILSNGMSTAEEWYRAYEKGKDKAEKNQCDEAEKLLQDALSKNAKSDNRSRPYGLITMEYLPHYYLGRCAFQKGDLQKAKEYLETAETSGIESSTKAAEFHVLKNRVLAKLAESAPVN